ncbi:MAG TPA: helix-turn-helix domain-containing protein, partial [Candidatus Brocadiia bacterium]|nr:helix-turn-helix domain-containing protein [Candidatus Brocadiia bacterium]
GPMDELVARSRLHTILMILLREALRPAPSAEAEASDYGARRRREIMTRARAYLEAHYRECVSLDDIADALSISPYYLSHVFSEESDFSLFEYLTSLRMAKAQDLLTQGGANISQVARAVGYESPNYFTKVFRKRFGAPPTRFAARA